MTNTESSALPIVFQSKFCDTFSKWYTISK